MNRVRRFFHAIQHYTESWRALGAVHLSSLIPHRGLICMVMDYVGSLDALEFVHTDMCNELATHVLHGLVVTPANGLWKDETIRFTRTPGGWSNGFSCCTDITWDNEDEHIVFIYNEMVMVCTVDRGVMKVHVSESIVATPNCAITHAPMPPNDVMFPLSTALTRPDAPERLIRDEDFRVGVQSCLDTLVHHAERWKQEATRRLDQAMNGIAVLCHEVMQFVGDVHDSDVTSIDSCNVRLTPLLHGLILTQFDVPIHFYQEENDWAYMSFYNASDMPHFFPISRVQWNTREHMIRLYVQGKELPKFQFRTKASAWTHPIYSRQATCPRKRRRGEVL